MANHNLSRVILLGGLSVNLNHLKTRNGRKPTPDSKMPDLGWDATEEIEATVTTKKTSKRDKSKRDK